MQEIPNDGDFEMIKKLNKELGLPKDPPPLSKQHNRVWWISVICMCLFPAMLALNTAVNLPIMYKMKADVAELKARDKQAQHLLYMHKMGFMELERECARQMGERGKSRQYMEKHCAIDFNFKDEAGRPVR